MSDYFKEYARVLFTHYGDRVNWIICGKPELSLHSILIIG